jgi:outer membrane protein OmpA-like peptidoglycan-associated protein
MHGEQRSAGMGGRELAVVIGILMVVVAGVIATHWVRERGAVVTAGPSAVEATPAVEPTRAQGPAPAAGEVFHADVYFDFKSTRLRAEAARVLQVQAEQMDRETAWVVLVQGYTDHRGPATYNKALALRRADAVKQFLIELGVAEESVKVVAVGQEGALCDDPSPECQQLNRRVHVEIRRLAHAAGPVRAAVVQGDTLDTEHP